VKLAKNKVDNVHYAVKILKKDNPHLDKKLMDLVVTEVTTMKELKHPNIVNLVEYNENAVVEKSNG
jgi:serine/threonine protein kinase